MCPRERQHQKKKKHLKKKLKILGIQKKKKNKKPIKLDGLV